MKEFKASNGCLIRECTTEEEIREKLLNSLGADEFSEIINCNEDFKDVINGNKYAHLLKLLYFEDGNVRNIHLFYHFVSSDGTMRHNVYYRWFGHYSFSRTKRNEEAFKEYYMTTRDDDWLESILSMLSNQDRLYLLHLNDGKIEEKIISSFEIRANKDTFVTIKFSDGSEYDISKIEDDGSINMAKWYKGKSLFTSYEIAKMQIGN